MTSLAQLSGQWHADPGVLAGAGLALTLFTRACWRLRRRGRADLTGADRGLLFLLGIAVVTAALESPLDPIGEDYLLCAHMLQHLLIGDVAPALTVLALRGPLLFLILPPAVFRPLARRRCIRGLLGGLLRPKVSFCVWALTIGLWHIPAAYGYALTHPLAHDLQHLSFLLAGLLAWAQLINPSRRSALRRSGRLAFAACLLVAGQALAGALILSPTPLYPRYAAQPARLLGITPLADQRLAGLVMLAEQTLAMGACAVLLLRRGAGQRAPRQHQQHAERTAPPTPVVVGGHARDCALGHAATGISRRRTPTGRPPAAVADVPRPAHPSARQVRAFTESASPEETAMEAPP